ncbi:MAG TPA: DUF779 domain-containing protein [Acidimicrobiia bacterium]|nr:DUF779 domain-containing protein [Acidimicrobiia bacterium]
MKVSASADAVELIERARRDRSGELVITLGTGCCESTAPFLYEDFWPGPDQEQVGEAAGVAIFAPEYLRRLYPDDEALVIDVNADDPNSMMSESMSIETEYGRRFTLRRPGEERSVRRERAHDAAMSDSDEDGTNETSVTPSPRPSRQVVGSLPEGLRRVRFR